MLQIKPELDLFHHISNILFIWILVMSFCCHATAYLLEDLDGNTLFHLWPPPPNQPPTLHVQTCLLLVPEPHNLQIHHLHLFLPPLFSFLYSIFFINIHSPVVFVIQHSWANAFVVCQTNLTVQYQMTGFWGKLPHVVFQHLLVICIFTGQWWRPKVWLRCLFTASLSSFLQTCFYPFIPSPFQNSV